MQGHPSPILDSFELGEIIERLAGYWWIEGAGGRRFSLTSPPETRKRRNSDSLQDCLALPVEDAGKLTRHRRYCSETCSLLLVVHAQSDH